MRLALPAPLLSHGGASALTRTRPAKPRWLARLATGARIATVGFGSSWLNGADAADVVVIVEPDAVLILDPKKQTSKKRERRRPDAPIFLRRGRRCGAQTDFVCAL